MQRRLWLLLLLFSIGIVACNDLDFNLNTYRVQIEVEPIESGSVSPAQDTLIDEGVEITLQAVNKEGYAFSGWSGDLNEDENPITILVYEDYNLRANFVKKKYELAIEENGRGEVLERVVSAKTYEHGTLVELSAQPALGYEFVEWTGDVESMENPTTIEMDSPKNVTATFRVKSTSAVLDVAVNWQEFNSLEGSGPTLSNSITHFGLHLDYVGSSEAGLKQSVVKSDAAQTELITVESTQNGPARLLATAVRTEGEQEKAFYFGVLENVVLEFGTQYEWSVADFSWRRAGWRVVDSLAVEYEEGTFIRDRSDPPFELWILISSPFNTAGHANILDLFVRVFDGGDSDNDTFAQESSYKNGFREFFIRASNLNRPEADTTEHTFYPFLDGQKFDLPAERYMVGEEGSFKVIWQ